MEVVTVVDYVERRKNQRRTESGGPKSPVNLTWRIRLRNKISGTYAKGAKSGKYTSTPQYSKERRLPVATMTVNKILIVGFLLILVTVMPVMAELTITHLDDGSTLFTNGSYWVKWEPVGNIGNHVRGDLFFINATTNLSPGTGIGCAILNKYFQQGPKNRKYFDADAGYFFVKSGESSGNNLVSCLFNTTELRPGTYYLEFNTFSSNISAEIDSFYWGYIVDYTILLSPADGESTIKPPLSPLSFAGTCGAIFVSLSVFWLMQRNESQRGLK